MAWHTYKKEHANKLYADEDIPILKGMIKISDQNFVSPYTEMDYLLNKQYDEHSYLMNPEETKSNNLSTWMIEYGFHSFSLDDVILDEIHLVDSVDNLGEYIHRIGFGIYSLLREKNDLPYIVKIPLDRLEKQPEPHFGAGHYVEIPKTYKQIDVKPAVLKGYIPKTSSYYKNEFGNIVSNSIVLTEELEIKI